MSGYFENNGFWDDLCDMDKCYEIGTKSHGGRVYCDEHWEYYAGMAGLTQVEEPKSTVEINWTDEDKIRARALGVF